MRWLSFLMLTLPMVFWAPVSEATPGPVCEFKAGSGLGWGWYRDGVKLAPNMTNCDDLNDGLVCLKGDSERVAGWYLVHVTGRWRFQGHSACHLGEYTPTCENIGQPEEGWYSMGYRLFQSYGKCEGKFGYCNKLGTHSGGWSVPEPSATYTQTLLIAENCSAP